MKTEKSCGAVVFKRCGREIRYVIICSKEGFFGFPKGHMECGESEKTTARREIKEEKSLKITDAKENCYEQSTLQAL